VHLTKIQVDGLKDAHARLLLMQQQMADVQVAKST
jgi:hypothetical protein